MQIAQIATACAAQFLTLTFYLMSALIIFGALAFFGLAHSITAALSLKEWSRRVLGDRLYHGTYRLVYNVLSVLTLAPALIALALLPDRTLYTVPLPWSLLLVGLQLGAALGALITLLMTDLPRFLGLSQLFAMLTGQPLPLPDVPFSGTGPYAWVRHPLYLFSLVVLWATPVMTVNILAFNVGATAYFYLGTFPEEKKLNSVYGDDYATYKRNVPRILPWPRPRALPDPTINTYDNTP